MKTINFSELFLQFKSSFIIDASTKKEYTYEEFYNQVKIISKELNEQKIPLRSIVIIYKIENPLETLLMFFACIEVSLIPFVVENEDVNELRNLGYKSIISTENKLDENYSTSKLESIASCFIHFVNGDNIYFGAENDFILVTSSKSTSTISKKILLGKKETLFNIISNSKSLPISSDDVTLILLPLSYSYGLIAQFLTHLYIGADIVLAPRILGIMQLKSIIGKYRITNIFLTPLLARLAFTYNQNYIENNLKFITLGGDKPSLTTIQNIYQILKCSIYGTYGLAEAGPRVATSKIDLNSDKVSLGRINVGIEASILEIEKYKYLLRCDRIGLLKIETPSTYLGYIEGDKLVAPSDNFLLTKDVVYSKDNQYYLLGRDDEFINNNSQIYWFQEMKDFFYNNPNVLKVKISKYNTNKIRIVIFYKKEETSKFFMEDTFKRHFDLRKNIDYEIELVSYQHNQYK